MDMQAQAHTHTPTLLLPGTIPGLCTTKVFQNIHAVLAVFILLKFNKARRKVLHLDWGNPKNKHMLGREWMRASPEEKDLEVLMEEKLNRNQQCANKAIHILGCIKAAWPAGPRT